MITENKSDQPNGEVGHQSGDQPFTIKIMSDEEEKASVKASVEYMKNNYLDLLEYTKMQAGVMWVKYDSLVKLGFTPEQAIYLTKQ